MEMAKNTANKRNRLCFQDESSNLEMATKAQIEMVSAKKARGDDIIEESLQSSKSNEDDYDDEDYDDYDDEDQNNVSDNEDFLEDFEDDVSVTSASTTVSTGIFLDSL